MQTIKKVWGIVSWVLVCVVVLAAVFLMGSRLLGYRVFNIVSGSMEPVYRVGDLIYVQEVDPNTVQPGDVITFVLNEDRVVATHRVVRVDAEKQRFYTKGDANETEDGGSVHFKNMIGVPKFKIPGLGYVADFIQKAPGLYITIAAVAVLLLLAFLPDLARKKPLPKADPAALEENARLKAELEALKAQLEKKDE
jgi:signal peptidase